MSPLWPCWGPAVPRHLRAGGSGQAGSLGTTRQCHRQQELGTHNGAGAVEGRGHSSTCTLRSLHRACPVLPVPHGACCHWRPAGRLGWQLLQDDDAHTFASISEHQDGACRGELHYHVNNKYMQFLSLHFIVKDLGLLPFFVIIFFNMMIK